MTIIGDKQLQKNMHIKTNKPMGVVQMPGRAKFPFLGCMAWKRSGIGGALFGWLLLVAAPLRADYSATSLHRMIMGADLIVQGEIIQTNELHFRLKIEQCVAGNHPWTTIQIRRFTDWTCARRWTPYAVGQRVFLFLRQEPDKSWAIMSGGDEGEMPLLQGKVYLHAIHGCQFLDFQKKQRNDQQPLQPLPTYLLYGDMFRGHPVKLDEFIAAITGMRECFQWIEGPTMSKSGIRPRVPAKQLEKYADKSTLHGWLADYYYK